MAAHLPLLDHQSRNHVSFFFNASFRRSLSAPDSNDVRDNCEAVGSGHEGSSSALLEPEPEREEDTCTDDEEFNMAAEELLEEALKNQSGEDPARFVSKQMPSRRAGNIGRSQSTLHRRSTFLLARQSSRRYLRTRSVCTSGELSGDVVSLDLIPSPEQDDVDADSCAGVATGDSDSEDDDDMLQRIKSAPYPMANKRTARDEMLMHKRKNGVHKDRPSWSSRWKRDMRTMRDKAGSTFSNVYFWNNTIYDIEGHYGPAVASVFVFIQWLMFLNLLMLLLVVMFIVIPHVTVLNTIPKNGTLPSYDFQVLSCAGNGSGTPRQLESSKDGLIEDEPFLDDIQDFLQGTGWMEWTEMFYGFYSYSYNASTQVYSNATIIGTLGFKYNLPMAYLFVTFTYFIVCFVLMMREVARGTREILFTTTGRLNECCTAVFSGWDFCVRKEKKAFIRHEMVRNELLAIVEDVKQEMARRNRTPSERMKLYTFRFLVNVAVVFVLMLCGYFIYSAFTISQHLLSNQMGRFQTLTVQFLPSITITVLNAIVPLIFEKCTKLEKYTPERVINVLLLRVVFLRLASIAVLLVTLYNNVYGGKSKDNCTLQCWETYVGQQIYKLALMDFGIGTLITFVIQLPRKYLVTRFEFCLTKWIGLPTFDIPAHVLDVVYSQSLCWMGTFYSPLLPVLNVVKFFVFFYVKQFALFVNCSQSCTNYRASKSKNLFILMLLFSFVLAIIPVAFSIGQITPSTACGPFMHLSTMWETVPNTMSTWPSTTQMFFSYFGTAGFTIPAVIALSLLIYYYVIVSSANKHEITLLQNQLLMEGQDKQFLLKKLKEVMAALGHD